MAIGCNEQQAGGVLGSLNDRQTGAPVDPLALPQRPGDGQGAEAERPLRSWITDALRRSARIQLSSASGVRAILARVENAPALSEGAALIWSFGDGQFAYGVEARHAYAVVGVYPITVAIAGRGAGPIQFDRVRAEVSEGAVSEQPDTLTPIAAAAVSPREGTAPLNVVCDGSLSAPGVGSIEEYAWDFGDGTTATGAHVSHHYEGAGTFEITLRVRDEGEETDLATVSITVLPPLDSDSPAVPGDPLDPFINPPAASQPDDAPPNPLDPPTPPAPPIVPNDPPTQSRPVEPPAQSQPAPTPPATQPNDPPASQPNNPPPPPPPPPATMPMPARAFLGYLPDGGYRVRDGFAGPVYRPIGISAMPALGQYGFRRYMSPGYMGIARSLEDARSYHQPLTVAARAAGLRWVPGFFLHHIIDNLYGVPSDPPWNQTGAGYDLNHPMNPSALGEQRFWDDLVNRARILATGAESNQVYIDSEFVFWNHMLDGFWTDANLAATRLMVRDAVARLRDEGIFLVMYHPFVNGSTPELRRIAVALFAPDDADDPLAQVEHFAPSPWVRIANYAIPEPSQTLAPYTAVGFQQYQVSYGFISDHAYGGYSAAQYDAYCDARPGLAEFTWFFCTGASVTRHAAGFAAIAEP